MIKTLTLIAVCLFIFTAVIFGILEFLRWLYLKKQQEQDERTKWDNQ